MTHRCCETQSVQSFIPLVYHVYAIYKVLHIKVLNNPMSSHITDPVNDSKKTDSLRYLIWHLVKRIPSTCLFILLKEVSFEYYLTNFSLTYPSNHRQDELTEIHHAEARMTVLRHQSLLSRSRCTVPNRWQEERRELINLQSIKKLE